METLAEREERVAALETSRRARRDESRALTRENVPAVMLPGPPGGAVTPRTALAVADVFACVRALVDTASTLPLIAYRRTGDGRTRYSGPLADLLQRPAPGKPGYALLADVMTSLNLHGDSFIGKFRDEEGAVSQLGVLDPARISVEIKAGLPLYTISPARGERQTVTDRDVLHVRSPLSLDGVRGLSPVAAAREAVESAAALSGHVAGTFRNGARPSGVLKVPPGPEQEEVMENLRAGFEARHGGAENAGRVAVLAAEVGFEPISIPPQDLQFVEQRQFASAEIARIFRLPPWVINAPTGDSLTYSTVEQQGQAFVTYALRPWLVAIEESINGDPDLTPDGVFCEFLIDALLRADSATRAQIFTAALNPDTGWLSRDEVRRLENLPAVPTTQEEPAHA